MSHGTLAHKLFAPLRVILPGVLSGSLRRLATAILTPLYFALDSGHFRSSIAGRSIAADGSPLPWLTYPAIAFLQNTDLSAHDILEFGSGNSTLFFATRARRVLSLETDLEWYRAVTKQVARLPLANTALHRVSCLDDVLNIMHEQEVGSRFDLILIDCETLDRVQLLDLCLAKQWLRTDGGIILDNADRYPFMPVIERWHLQRVDFYGYAPAVVMPHCTSLVFEKRCSLLERRWSIVEARDLIRGQDQSPRTGNPPGRPWSGPSRACRRW